MSNPSDPGFQGIDQTSLDQYLFRIAAAVTTSTEQVPSDHLGNPDPNPSWDLGSNYRYYPNFTAPGGGTTNFDDRQASVNLHPSHLNTRWESDSDIQTPADGDTVIGSGPHLIAYIINSQGSVFPITGEAQPQNIEGHSKLHFLGFLILDDAMMVKPFFTDQSCFFQDRFGAQWTLDQAKIVLLGVMKKASCEWRTPIYADSRIVSIDRMRQTLTNASIRPVYMASDGNLRLGVYVYELSDDDIFFQPWELGKSRAIISPQVLLEPDSTVVPLDLHKFTEVPQATSSSTAHPPPFIGTSGPRRARGHVFEAARHSKKRKGAPITIALIRSDFPQLLTTVGWAKARYRSLSLFAPYVSGTPEKLLTAETAYDFGLIKHHIDTSVYPNLPSRDAMAVLIAGEHSTFRTNSIDRAKAAIEAAFPLTLAATDIAKMLTEVCSPQYISRFPTLGWDASSLGSVDVGYPFSGAMVLDLLHKIINQRVKSCKIDLRDLLVGDIPDGTPLPVIFCVYSLSLLFDACVNRFKSKLSSLPAKDTITIIPRHLFRKASDTCDAFKFHDFHEMWMDCEKSDEFGAGLQAMRINWRDTIFTAVTTDSED